MTREQATRNGEATVLTTDRIATLLGLETIALGKQFGDADRDLGPVMVFFASDASHFITGQLIPVDGGQASVR